MISCTTAALEGLKSAPGKFSAAKVAKYEVGNDWGECKDEWSREHQDGQRYTKDRRSSVGQGSA